MVNKKKHGRIHYNKMFELILFYNMTATNKYIMI